MIDAGIALAGVVLGTLYWIAFKAHRNALRHKEEAKSTGKEAE